MPEPKELTLNEDKVKSDPIEQFQQWYQEAQQNCPGQGILPEAMTLATANDAAISARVVLLKHVDVKGFVFYTNYTSRKGSQLAVNADAALVFHWPYLQRQVRIEGRVKRVSREESKAYFHSRPRGSQLAALASEQSHVIEGRAVLEARYRELERAYAGREVPLPDTWGGYRLRPYNIEFWQGRDNRLHDRLLYTQIDGDWTIERLAP